MSLLATLLLVAMATVEELVGTLTWAGRLVPWAALGRASVPATGLGALTLPDVTSPLLPWWVAGLALQLAIEVVRALRDRRRERKRRDERQEGEGDGG